MAGGWVLYVGVKAPVTATPVIGDSVKAMCIGYDPLIRRFGLVNRDLISNLVGLGPLSGRIYFLTVCDRLALQGDMFLSQWVPCFRTLSSTTIGSVSDVE